MSAPPPPPTPYAFVSYASADRAWVLPVVAALRGAGVPVWLDEQGIAGGENYAAEIAEAIKGAAAFLLLASPTSLASRNVKQEIALAWRYERPYVPLRLDPVAIPDDLAYWLEAAQWLDVLDRPPAAWLPPLLAALAPFGIAPPAMVAAPPERLPGREREQALLRERLDAMLAGRGGLVLVGGEAGVGKTTLVEAALAEAVARGGLALTGRCYDLAETPPYGPWVELFARHRPGPGDPPHPPAFAQRGTVGAVASQATLVVEVRHWLAAVAERQQVALLLDDLHWADPASLDLRALARDLADMPVLLLATYREDELTRRHPLYQLLPVLEREAHAQRLDLRRFDVEGVRALVLARYALPDADADRLVAWLSGRAEGNAFFTAQLLRVLEDDGLLAARDGAWALGQLCTVGLPAPLRQVLDARLARLGEAALRLLMLAAVIGQEVPLALWATVAETDEDGLLDTIERAVEARLLVALPDGTAVGIAHALIREALYEGMLPMRRRRVHRRVAEALAATVQPDPDAVAYHFQRAGDPRAAEWLERAGDRAKRAYAWLTATERYEAALALVEGGGGGAGERGWLTLHLASTCRYDDERRALGYAEEAARLAGEAGDRLLAGMAAFLTGMVRCGLGEPGRGIAQMAAALDALEALPPAGRVPPGATAPLDPALRRGSVVTWLAGVGRYAEALAAGERYLAEVAPPAAADWLGGNPYADALGGLGLAHAGLGQPDLARAALARARALHRAVGQHSEVAFCAMRELQVALPYQADRPAELRQLAAEADAALERASGRSPLSFPARVAWLLLLVLGGRWVEARALAEQTMASAVNDRTTAALAPLARDQGDHALAWELLLGWLPEGPQMAPGQVWPLYALPLQRLAAALALDAGDQSGAQDWLAAHDRWLAWSGAILGQAEGQLGWAAYHRATGNQALAHDHAARALAHATDPRQPLALLAAHRLLGELDTDSADYAAAADHLAQALVLADACAAPYERALTLLARAELHAATGDRPAALADLAAVTAICTPLGANPALARAAALAARLGDAG